MDQQALMQLAGEHRDAVHPDVVAEPMTGEADLASAAALQDFFIEIGPLLDGLLQGATGTNLAEPPDAAPFLARPEAAECEIRSGLGLITAETPLCQER